MYLAVSTRDNSAKRIQLGSGNDLNSKILGNKEDEDGNKLNSSDEESNSKIVFILTGFRNFNQKRLRRRSRNR